MSESVSRAVVLLSGGIDSSTLLNYVKSTQGVTDLYALSFLYGQKHARELEMAAWQADRAGVREHRVIDIGFFASLTEGGSALTSQSVAVPDLASLASSSLDQPSTYVPNRNMMLLSIAAAYAESKGVSALFYGAQAQDRYGYWDCTTEFVDRMNSVLALNRRTPVQVCAPFVGMTKGAVVKIGLELGVDYRHTWTCYRGGEIPCGSCPSCEERRLAFLEVNTVDPLEK